MLTSWLQREGYPKSGTDYRAPVGETKLSLSGIPVNNDVHYCLKVSDRLLSRTRRGEDYSPRERVRWEKLVKIVQLEHSWRRGLRVEGSRCMRAFKWN